MKIFKLAIPVLLLVSGCASTLTSNEIVLVDKPLLNMNQKEKWNKMTGKWYGEQKNKDGGVTKWIKEASHDGSYKIVFRTYLKYGGFSERVEMGQWGVSGPVYFSIYRGHVVGEMIIKEDPSNPYNYDTYEILELSDKLFKYKHYDTGGVYTVKKVSDDFKFTS